jgi:hypothetical protein
VEVDEPGGNRAGGDPDKKGAPGKEGVRVPERMEVEGRQTDAQEEDGLYGIARSLGLHMMNGFMQT